MEDVENMVYNRMQTHCEQTDVDIDTSSIEPNKSVTYLDLSNFNTGDIEDMSNMFRDYTELVSLIVTNWRTYNVTTMANMFHNCTSLTYLDLST